MNKYLELRGTGSDTTHMDSASVEEVISTANQRNEDLLYIDELNSVLDDVGVENIPTPALELMTSKVSKDEMEDKGSVEEMITALVYFGALITSVLLEAIVTKILTLKANKKIKEISGLIKDVDARIKDKSKTDIVASLSGFAGLVNLYANGGNSANVVGAYSKVEEAVNEMSSKLSDNTDIPELFKAMDKVIFADPINVKGIGKSVLTFYANDGVGVVAERDLEFYFYVSGKATDGIVKDILADVKKNLTESAVMASLNEYQVAIYQIQESIAKVEKRFSELAKERGDGFFKRFFGNRKEKKALRTRSKILYDLAYKNFVGSYGTFIGDIHGLLKELKKD